MFNNRQNNTKDNKVNVNTIGFQFYNKEGFDPSTMVLGFWNSLFSLKMHPAKEKEKQTENDVFDYEKVINTALTIEKAQVLMHGVKNIIIPALENGEVRAVGVVVSGNNIVTVGTKKIDEQVVSYIAIHKALNENRIPEMSCYYEFKESQMIMDYDESTGNYTKAGAVGELSLFHVYLEQGINALTNAHVHSARSVDNFYRKRLTEDIKAISASMGITTDNSSGGGKRYTNLFDDSTQKSNSSSSSKPETPIDNMSSLDELGF